MGSQAKNEIVCGKRTYEISVKIVLTSRARQIDLCALYQGNEPALVHCLREILRVARSISYTL
jgi:hypothetical protein